MNENCEAHPFMSSGTLVACAGSAVGLDDAGCGLPGLSPGGAAGAGACAPCGLLVSGKAGGGKGGMGTGDACFAVTASGFAVDKSVV